MWPAACRCETKGAPPLRIKFTAHADLLVSLNPDDCPLLAGGAPHRLAGRTASYLFYFMACTLDGDALACDARGRFSGQDADGYNLANIARVQGVPPGQRKGAR